MTKIYGVTDWVNVLRFQVRHHGKIKGVIRSLKRHHRRQWSRHDLAMRIRSLPTSHDPIRGIEIGAGEQTVAPLRLTLLSDGFKAHAGNESLATEFFPADQIPYPDQQFSYLISEHVLEHVPDPIKTLTEWVRVVKPGGFLWITLPHPERTFDCYRTPTPVAQILRISEHGGPNAQDNEQAWLDWKTQVLDRGIAPHYAQIERDKAISTGNFHRWVFTPETVKLLLAEMSDKGLIPSVEVFVAETVPDRGDSFLVSVTRVDFTR